MDKEFAELTGVQSRILKDTSPDSLLAFTMEKFEKELQYRAPIMWDLLQLLSMYKWKKIKVKSSTASEQDTTNIPLCVAVAAMLLKSRHPEMSELAYREWPNYDERMF